MKNVLSVLKKVDGGAMKNTLSAIQAANDSAMMADIDEKVKADFLAKAQEAATTAEVLTKHIMDLQQIADGHDPKQDEIEKLVLLKKLAVRLRGGLKELSEMANK